MELRQERDGGRLVIHIIGVLNTMTAPDLEAILGDNLADVDELIFDISKMEYTSSAGLRAFLGAQQYMDDKDADMAVRGVNDIVMEIFEETGFTNLLNIED